MKQYIQQLPDEIVRFLKTPLSLLGQHLLLTIMIALVFVCASCGASTEPQAKKVNSTKIPQPISESSTPLSSATVSSIQWKTLETITGSGVKRTAPFTASVIWRIVWSCDLSSHHNTSYDLTIHANSSTNALLANSIETTCQKNNTHSYTVMRQTGTIYLSIISEGSWTVQIQLATY